MKCVLVLLQSLKTALLNILQTLRIAHPNRLPVAPFYGVSRMPEVRWPKRIPTSRVAVRRPH